MADVEKANGSNSTYDQTPLVHQYQNIGIRKIANPAPLGLFAFASTTFMLSLYNLQTREILIPNLIVGMALGFGGLAQLLAGQWEFVTGNTFGATAFSSYGAFWISFGLIFWPGSGIIDAYVTKNAVDQLNNALGIYLITWFIVTFLFFIASIKTHASFNALFGALSITFILLAAGFFTGNVMVTKAGGGVGIFTALVAYYTGCAGLFSQEDSLVTLPRGWYRRID